MPRSRRRSTTGASPISPTPTARRTTIAPSGPTPRGIFDHALADLDAAREAVADAGRIGIIGFCWGGSLAWLSACRGDYAGAVSYYGSMIPDLANEQARCPVICHIGDKDTSLPAARIAIFRAAQPNVPVFMYEGAPHGFDNENRTERYHPAAHKLARERTLEFLAKHIG